MLWLFMRISGWVALIPLALGAAIVFVGTLISEDAARLEADGVDTQATIIAKREYERRSSNNASTTTYYNLRYHFPLESGGLHYGDRDVSYGFYEDVETGMQRPLRYLPSDPDLHEIEPGAVDENALYATIFGAVLLLIGAGLLWLFTRNAMRMKAVRDHGQPAQATIDEIMKQTGANGFKFSFTDRMGASHSGSSITGRAWRTKDVAAGDVVPIRYDPQQPKRAYWARDLGLEA